MGGSNRFCIFKEHRTGLWYVRRSDDIINQGMFVALNGFEYQVYLEVQEVVDTEEGKYAKLHELLNGAGTSDLEITWQEYRYKDLYIALSKFATPELFQKIKTLLTPVAVLKANNIALPNEKEVLDSIKNDALAYYEVETKFADENVSLSNAKETKAKTAKTSKTAKKTGEISAAERYEAFCKQIEYLSSAMANAQGLETETPASEKAKTAAKVAFDTMIYEGIMGSAIASGVLTAFAISSSAGKENCLKWGYDRKLGEFLSKTGIDHKEASDILHRLFIMMKIRDLSFAPSASKKSTYETAVLLADSGSAFELSGAHEYNGVKWFNKERMESTIWYGFVAAAMCSPRTQREHIQKLHKTIVAAKDGAEYKCAAFTDALNPNSEAGVKTQAKKTRARKAPAKAKAKKGEEGSEN